MVSEAEPVLTLGNSFIDKIPLRKLLSLTLFSLKVRDSSMGKQNVAYPHNGILFGHRKE